MIQQHVKKTALDLGEGVFSHRARLEKNIFPHMLECVFQTANGDIQSWPVLLFGIVVCLLTNEKHCQQDYVEMSLGFDGQK